MRHSGDSGLLRAAGLFAARRTATLQFSPNMAIHGNIASNF